MSKWPESTLHKKISIKHGFPFKSEYFVEKGDLIVLTPGNFFEEGGFKREIGKEKYYNGPISKEYVHKQGDLIIAMTEQAKGLLGSCAIVPEDDLYLHNQRLGLVTTNDLEVDKMFFYHLFKTKNIRKQLTITSTGSKVKHTSPDRIYELKVNLPPIVRQGKIARFLSDIDAKIELHNKINEQLEAMAKLIYDYWFMQFDFPDSNGKPYKSSGGKMLFNEELKREIPEGWEVKKLVDEMDIQYGFPFSTKLFNEESIGRPIIRIRDILNNTISIFSTEDVDKKYKIEKGDLVVGMDGNFHMNFWDKDGCYLNQRSVRIRKTEGSKISQFQALFEIKPYIQAREKNVSRTTVGHLSVGDINALNVLVPHPKKKSGQNKIFDCFLDKIITNRNQSQILTKLRDWLLPMLMNGQVSVKEV